MTETLIPAPPTAACGPDQLMEGSMCPTSSPHISVSERIQKNNIICLRKRPKTFTRTMPSSGRTQYHAKLCDEPVCQLCRCSIGPHLPNDIQSDLICAEFLLTQDSLKRSGSTLQHGFLSFLTTCCDYFSSLVGRTPSTSSTL